MSFALGSLYSEEIHRPFAFEGGENAVVLVHGFPGTPAETRALGEQLHDAGYSAFGLLLPGFGPGMDTLFDHKAEDWIGAVVEKVAALRMDYERVFLLGYSFGGAVVLHAAEKAGAAGVILIAPFWRIGGRRERWIWRFTSFLFPSFKPFRRMDFSRPQLTGGLQKMLPGIDLSDAEVQEALRQLRVPARGVEEIMKLGAGAKDMAHTLSKPALILQGLQDEVISTDYTRELVSAFSIPPQYMEFDAGHGLLEQGAAGFGRATSAAIEFLNGQTAAVDP